MSWPGMPVLPVSFREPDILWFALLAPLVVLFCAGMERRRVAVGRRFVSDRLRGTSHPLRMLRPWMLGVASLLAVVALAGPQAGFTTLPVELRESTRVVAIDVSLSMAAEDVGTSRLDAARALARRIVEAQQGRVGLVIFESSAEVVSPLTTDDEAVESLLDTIEAGEVTHPGSDLGAAMTQSQKLLEADAGQRGDIVLISDGEDQGNHTEEVTARLKSRGIVVSTVLLGTSRGSTIPRGERGSPLRDDNGEVVITSSHPEAMRRIAAQTGGKFFANPFGEHDLDLLAESGGSLRRKQVRIPVERYQWPLAAALLFVFAGSVINRGAE